MPVAQGEELVIGTAQARVATCPLQRCYCYGHHTIHQQLSQLRQSEVVRHKTLRLHLAP